MAKGTDVTPDVSIIITTYNVEQYIERAVESALAQRGLRVEVIIVDDVSSDNTWTIISAITDDRVKSLRLARNGGPSVARNAAIALATAPWLAMLDGDDAFDPDRLARCLAKARTMKADIVVDNLMIRREIDGASFPMYAGKFKNMATLTLPDFISGNRSFTKGFTLGYLKPIFSSEFLRNHKIVYDQDIRIGEDYLFLADALACGAVCAVEQSAGYLYTVRASSISHRLVPEDLLRIMQGDERFLSRRRLTGKAARAQKQREFCIREVYAFCLIVQSLKRKNPVQLAKAILVCPTSVRHLWQPVWARLSRLAKPKDKVANG